MESEFEQCLKDHSHQRHPVLAQLRALQHAVQEVTQVLEMLLEAILNDVELPCVDASLGALTRVLN